MGKISQYTTSTSIVEGDLFPFTALANMTTYKAEWSTIKSMLGITDGWTPINSTLYYISANSFYIAGDWTSKINIRDKIKFTQTNPKYFIVTAVSYSSPNTTFTVMAGTTYTVANAGITLPYFSHGLSPVGFPASFAYTPTITATSGTFTSVSATGIFSAVGRRVDFKYAITITTNGTAAGAVVATMPISPTATCIIPGRENTATGKMLQGIVSTGGGMNIYDYSGAYPGGDGRSLIVSGSYFI